MVTACSARSATSVRVPARYSLFIMVIAVTNLESVQVPNTSKKADILSSHSFPWYLIHSVNSYNFSTRAETSFSKFWIFNDLASTFKLLRRESVDGQIYFEMRRSNMIPSVTMSLPISELIHWRNFCLLSFQEGLKENQCQLNPWWSWEWFDCRHEYRFVCEASAFCLRCFCFIMKRNCGAATINGSDSIEWPNCWFVVIMKFHNLTSLLIASTSNLSRGAAFTVSMCFPFLSGKSVNSTGRAELTTCRKLLIWRRAFREITRSKLGGLI